MQDRFALFAMAILLGIVTGLPAAEEILKNPDFSKKLDGWEFSMAREYRDKVSPPVIDKGEKGDNPVFTVNVSHESGAMYLRLHQEVAVEVGNTYRLFFDLRSDGHEGPLRVRVGYLENNQGKVNGLHLNVDASDEWVRHEVLFKVQKDPGDSPNTFHVGFGNFKGRVHLRDFSLTDVTDSGVQVTRKGGELITGKDIAVASQEPEDETDEPTDRTAPRTWTSTSGASLEAVFVSHAVGMVTLKRTSDGKSVRIPLKNLSKADQEWVNSGGR